MQLDAYGKQIAKMQTNAIIKAYQQTFNCNKRMAKKNLKRLGILCN